MLILVWYQLLVWHILGTCTTLIYLKLPLKPKMIQFGQVSQGSFMQLKSRPIYKSSNKVVYAFLRTLALRGPSSGFALSNTKSGSGFRTIPGPGLLNTSQALITPSMPADSMWPWKWLNVGRGAWTSKGSHCCQGNHSCCNVHFEHCKQHGKHLRSCMDTQILICQVEPL